MMYIVWAYLGVGLVYFVFEFSGILRDRRSRGLSIWRSEGSEDFLLVPLGPLSGRALRLMVQRVGIAATCFSCSG